MAAIQLILSLMMSAQAATVLVPIPRYGFDPTEVAVPVKYLREAGHTVVFATPDGSAGRADERMVTGRDLGPLKFILAAAPRAVRAYRALEQSPEFQAPRAYEELRAGDYDALFLPGGHDKGMREYLESAVLQKLIAEFFEADKPVAAICHGTLLAGRSISPRTGKSVLYGRRTTGLTRRQELSAFLMTRSFLGDYYRTYSVPMEDELRGYLQDRADYTSGPGFPVPMTRDTEKFLAFGYTVRDGNYLSARWPGDAHRFGRDFVAILAGL